MNSESAKKSGHYLVYWVLLAVLVLSHTLWAASPPRLDDPKYKERWYNRDNSLRYTFKFGSGIALPTGITGNYQNTAWNLKFGGGYNLNKRLGAVIEYDYVDFGIPQHALGVLGNGNAGRVHVWSFTLNPEYNVYLGDSLRVYAVGGGGYYRNAVRSTSRADCTGSPGCLNPANVVSYYGGGSGGWNGGAGIAWKVSYLDRARYFLEARYVAVDDGPAPQRTTPLYLIRYIPITAGIRW